MSLLRRWIAVLLLLSPLLVDAPRATAEDGEASLPPAWDDRAFLERTLVEAWDAVVDVVGLGVGGAERPTLKFTEAQDMALLLMEEVGALWTRLAAGDEDEARKVADLLSTALMGKYATKGHEVHICLANITRLTDEHGRPEVRTPGVMRVLIAHECAHALDFKRHPSLDVVRQSLGTADEVQAFGAVLEGHAQFVAEVVAARWGLEREFAQLTELLGAMPAVDGVAMQQVAEFVQAEARFAYIQGHAFVRAVAAARGREGLEALLAAPPKDTRTIEQPASYLDPTQVSTFDPSKAFAILGGALGDGWTYVEVPLKRAALEAALILLPAEARADLLPRYRNGFVQAGSSAEQHSALVVMEWADEESSRAYMDQARRLHAIKDEAMGSGEIHIESATYVEGVGKEREGFSVTKVVRIGTASTVVRAHHARVGELGIELMFIDADVADERIAELMESVLVALGAPALQESR